MRHRTVIPVAAFVGLLTIVLLVTPNAASALSTTTLATMTQPNGGYTHFGFTVAGAGDLDGDGYSDVVVGAYNSQGDAYLYFGGATPNGTADITFETAFNTGFGYSVASAGDVNGDGHPDLIIAEAGTGKAYLYYGGPFIDNVADLTLTVSGLAYAVSSAGDMNGDGYADVAVVGSSNVSIFFGGASPNSVVDLTLPYGTSVAPAGDVNGDGFGDVIVGAESDGTGGKAYVYFGGSSPDAVADLTLTGEASGDSFGHSVGAGDVNGDGKSDLIVGAPYNDTGGVDAGRAYVFYGGSSPDAVADLTFTGAAAGDRFGFGVSSAGDMNGDGSADVVVGAPRNDAVATDAGRAYVFFGGVGADATADLTMSGAAAYDNFGDAVSSADMNGDGHPDVIVAAETDPINGSGPGHVYVISLTLPAISQSYYVPQVGTLASPSEGQTAIAKFFTCPNNDGSALGNNARVKLVVKDSGGSPIVGIAASDINLRFNGGTAAQGFTGPYADSIIANSTYNPTCPDVRRINADAATDANGVTYITFKGVLPGNPGVGVRDSTRKWGHYDSEIPVYVLGVKMDGRLTSVSSNGSYVLLIKNIDFESGLGTVLNQGEAVTATDYNSFHAHFGQADSADPKNWWRDFNSDGTINSIDLNIFSAHMNHNCTSPNNP